MYTDSKQSVVLLMDVVESLRGKENLLIAIGDSWTMGVGAYSPEVLEKIRNGEPRPLDYHSNDSVSIFAEHNWPQYLAQKLDWDLINLGEGGMGNTGCAKKLVCDYDIIRKVNYKKYKKIILIFLLSVPDRHTFYSEQRYIKILPNLKGDLRKDATNACNALFYDHVYKSILDPLLETRFALKTVEAYCKAHNIKFLYGSAFHNIKPLTEIYDTPSNIHHYIPHKKNIKEFIPIPETDWFDPRFMSTCGHPNREGYRIIADGLYDALVKCGLVNTKDL